MSTAFLGERGWGGGGGAFTMKRSAAEGDGRGESKAKQTTCRNIFLKGSEIW